MLAILVLIVLISGCTNTRNDTEDFNTSTAQLTVTAKLDNIITNNSSSALAVEDQLDLSEVEIIITNINNPRLKYQDDQEISDEQEQVSFEFDDLNLDNKYQIEVKVKDDQGHYVYQATEQTVITNAVSSFSIDELQFLEVKNVMIKLNNLAADIDKAQLSLVTKDANTYTKEVEIDSDTNSVEFDFSEEDIEVGQYDLNLSLFTEKQEVYSEQKREILILPNQITTIAADFKNSFDDVEVAVSYQAEELEVDNFRWDNSLIYYVIVDRFYNANTKNDSSYGRPQVDATGSELGTFHGGDIVGLTEKIKAGYFDKLGINTICITAPYEQIHGFISGEQGDFARYAYDGYHALDYTTIDKNIGTVSEFREFVTTAHQHQLKVVMDVVFNHPGQITIQDMKEYNFGNWAAEPLSEDWEPSSGESWNHYQNYIDYFDGAEKWANWWGPNWVRADLAGYTSSGDDRLTKLIDGLADFKTEIKTEQSIPPLLATKWQQEKNYEQWIVPAAEELRSDLERPPAQYLINWLTAWVEEFGIDGFRCRDVSYVSQQRWGELKQEAQLALEKWRRKNPQAPGAEWEHDFWFLGQVKEQGIKKSSYYQDHNDDSIPDFDALLNTTYPPAMELEEVGSLWTEYALQLNNGDGFNAVNYISDSKRGLGAVKDKIAAGTRLLLSPGSVQIWYGEEVNKGANLKEPHSKFASNSDYPWNNQQQKVLEHWQKLGQFRAKHPAVAVGEQIELAADTYSRTWDSNNDGVLDDKVVIKINASGEEKIKVANVFADGTTVRNYYTGDTAVVSEGTVKFAAVNDLILIEAIQ
ncbi:MAG: alpha-amylase family glycosyl hydrolase [Bacillota bacterium]